MKLLTAKLNLDIKVLVIWDLTNFILAGDL
jgi:hypothetical protein